MSINQYSFSKIPSGFSELDEKINGFKNSELILITSLPNIGKTSFALNITTNVSLQYNKKVGFFSCKLDRNSLVRKMMYSEAGFNEMTIRKGILTEKEKEQLIISSANLYNTTIVFNDTPNISILELLNEAHDMKQNYNIDILFIDYFQLITVDKEMGNNAKNTYISKSLKELAVKLNIPIILLVQLPKKLIKQNNESSPGIFDFKDLASIEQDADVIIFIHKPDKESVISNNNQDIEIRELIIVKNRVGSTGSIKMSFDKKTLRFQSFK